jgi:hypothetical protein
LSHPCLGLSSGLLPSGFLTKTQYAPFFSCIRATCPAHLSLLFSLYGTYVCAGLRVSLSSSSPSPAIGVRWVCWVGLLLLQHKFYHPWDKSVLYWFRFGVGTFFFFSSVCTVNRFILKTAWGRDKWPTVPF